MPCLLSQRKGAKARRITKNKNEYEQEMKRLEGPYPVEFDGRDAAVAREEATGKIQDELDSASCFCRLLLPPRADGANSTCQTAISWPPVLIRLCALCLCVETRNNQPISSSEIIMLRTGIVGLPNVGKSTLFKFNA